MLRGRWLAASVSSFSTSSTNPNLNSLSDSLSPYLLQHAHNPVNWEMWTAQTLERAILEDKPIFLSVGYSSCHWCHIMNHESFENEEIAEILNENFIPVKVDREERPDIDALYMELHQAYTGQGGGWPLSVWLTPSQEPIYFATYLPPEDRLNMPGFKSLLEAISAAWEENRDEIAEFAISSIEKRKLAMETTLRYHVEDNVEFGELSEWEQYERAALEFHDWQNKNFDDADGGFGAAPKFPCPHQLSTMLRLTPQDFQRDEDRHQKAADMHKMAIETLERITLGGIHDHIGGGFHRYAVDSNWLTPHFEKMLYDQAGLVHALLDAFVLTGDGWFEDVVNSTLDYCERMLRSETGAFYSSEDADSEGIEGKFYVWSWEELESVGREEMEIASSVYGCRVDGNFKDEATGVLTGENIPHLKERQSLSPSVVEFKRKLFEIREQRVAPGLDTKILTDWNGMIVGAFARAGAILENQDFVLVASEAANFLLDACEIDGVLQHRYVQRNGDTSSASLQIPGFSTDSAFLIEGLLFLYYATLESEFLVQAKRLAEDLISGFFCEETGLIQTRRIGDDDLILPHYDTYDGAHPSTNSTAALCLSHLAVHFPETPLFEVTAKKMVEGLKPRILAHPVGHSQAFSAFRHVLHGPGMHVKIVGVVDGPDVKDFLNELHRTELDFAIELQLPVESDEKDPHIEICQENACKLIEWSERKTLFNNSKNEG